MNLKPETTEWLSSAGLLQGVNQFIADGYDSKDRHRRTIAVEIASAWTRDHNLGFKGKVAPPSLEILLKELCDSRKLYSEAWGYDPKSHWKNLCSCVARFDFMGDFNEPVFSKALYAGYRIQLPEDVFMQPFDTDYVDRLIQETTEVSRSEESVRYVVETNGLDSKIILLEGRNGPWTQFGDQLVILLLPLE